MLIPFYDMYRKCSGLKKLQLEINGMKVKKPYVKNIMWKIACECYKVTGYNDLHVSTMHGIMLTLKIPIITTLNCKGFILWPKTWKFRKDINHNRSLTTFYAF